MSQDKNSENSGKTRNRHTQQRNKKNNDSRSCSRSKNQHNSHKLSTNKTINNVKKEWPKLTEALKVERRKKWPFFRKIRPYKQRKEKRFQTVEIKNYGGSETNNNEEQNQHTITVPGTQDVPNNQVEENLFSVSLTPLQIQILSKAFTPTPQRSLPDMEKDIEDFTRKLRLA